VQKNGGNVAGYFCTTKGRVVHAVVGPVSADELLEAANWAVDAHDRARDAAQGDQTKFERLIESAHLEALGVDPGEFRNLVRAAGLSRRSRSQWEARYPVSYGGREPRTASEKAAARQVGLRREILQPYATDEVHLRLAADPLPRLVDVAGEFFEDLANQPVSRDRSAVLQAAKDVETARERKMPLVFVLYAGGPAGFGAMYDTTMRYYADTVLSHPDVTAALKKCMVIVLGRNEMAALSTQVDLPLYEVMASAGPTLILARPTGEQIAALGMSLDGAHVAAQIWAAVNDSRLARAESLSDDGNRAAARRTLDSVRRSAPGSSQAERAAQLLAQTAGSSVRPVSSLGPASDGGEQ
jgi:hypothetical protein